MRIPKWWMGVVAFGLGVLVLIAAVTKISEYPAVTTPATNDLFLLASGATNKHVRYDNLKNAVNSGVSNVIATNITAVTINSTTNIVNVAKGGHVTVENTFTLLPAGPNKLLRTDSDTNVVAATIGSGLAFDGTTLSATGGGGASVWVPTTALTYSGGTNVTMHASGGTNFTVEVTNTTFMAAPSNPPGSSSTNTTWTVTFKMDATGGYVVTWTNLFKGPQFQPLTNANAVSMVTITTSTLTNGQYFLDYGLIGLQ